MLSGMGGMTAFAPMLRQLGGAMLGGQVGTAIGELASEMATSTDIGLPLAPEGTAALLPSGVAAFGDGLSVDPGEVRLFLALREAAHHRLFGHVPWLRQHLLGAVEAYAAGITIDMSKLRDALPDMDMANPEEALRDALSGETLFRPEDTPQQKAALVPPGDRARPGRGVGGDRGLRRRRLPAGAQRGAGRGDPSPPGLRRPVGTDLRRPGRARAAAPDAARGGGAVGRRDRRRAGSTAGTRSGRTRTCCRRRTTWPTRTRSCAARPSSTSPISRKARPTRRTSRRPGRRSRPGADPATAAGANRLAAARGRGGAAGAGGMRRPAAPLPLPVGQHHLERPVGGGRLAGPVDERERLRGRERGGRRREHGVARLRHRERAARRRRPGRGCAARPGRGPSCSGPGSARRPTGRGRTSGPTTPIASSACTTRCGTPVPHELGEHHRVGSAGEHRQVGQPPAVVGGAHLARHPVDGAGDPG